MPKINREMRKQLEEILRNNQKRVISKRRLHLEREEPKAKNVAVERVKNKNRALIKKVEKYLEQKSLYDQYVDYRDRIQYTSLPGYSEAEAEELAKVRGDGIPEKHEEERLRLAVAEDYEEVKDLFEN